MNHMDNNYGAQKRAGASHLSQPNAGLRRPGQKLSSTKDVNHFGAIKGNTQLKKRYSLKAGLLMHYGNDIHIYLKRLEANTNQRNFLEKHQI
jgi:hypothetical protein